jgi:hypothetical protein
MNQPDIQQADPWDERDEDFDEGNGWETADSVLGEEGCLFPGKCVMSGPHFISECHTAEDILLAMRENEWERFAACYEKCEGVKPDRNSARIQRFFHYFCCGADENFTELL